MYWRTIFFMSTIAFSYYLFTTKILERVAIGKIPTSLPLWGGNIQFTYQILTEFLSRLNFSSNLFEKICFSTVLFLAVYLNFRFWSLIFLIVRYAIKIWAIYFFVFRSGTAAIFFSIFSSDSPIKQGGVQGFLFLVFLPEDSVELPFYFLNSLRIVLLPFILRFIIPYVPIF